MKINKLAILFASVILVSGLLKAQNYNDGYRLSEQSIDYDARTLSMGNSTIASWGSFSSTLINPAGLATIRKNIVTLSFNSNQFDNKMQFFNSSMSSNKKK